MSTKCARLGCSQRKTGPGGFWKKVTIITDDHDDDNDDDNDDDDDDDDNVVVQDIWLCSMHCLAAWKAGNTAPPKSTPHPKPKKAPTQGKANVVPSEAPNPFSLLLDQPDDE